MNHRSFVFLAAAAVLTTGCPSFVNAKGPQFAGAPVPQGKAVVHFYRPAQKVMSDYAFFMSLPENANNCYRLESGGYVSHVSDPGKLTVAGAMLSYKRMSFDLKAGEERFVEVDIVDDDAALREVPSGEAKPKIAITRGIETCSPEDLKKKH